MKLLAELLITDPRELPDITLATGLKVLPVPKTESRFGPPELIRILQVNFMRSANNVILTFEISTHIFKFNRIVT
jgi:hypothetical protein